MAKYKQIEFARMCGKDRTFLPPYIKNGKVIVEEGMIDDSNPINSFFLEKWSGRTKEEKSNKTEENTGQNSEQAQESTISEEKKGGKRGKKTAVLEYRELERIKKGLDIEKTQQEIELLEKRNAKMDGESIPTDLVKNIFTLYGKNIVTSFHNSAENWLTKIGKSKGLSDPELAEMRGELAKGINEAVNKAQAESKRSISSIIKEYSLKKEVGEHE